MQDSGTPKCRSSRAEATGRGRFYRQRTRGACVTCQSRKIRCDAGSLGIPCTNCAAFSVDCHVPSKSWGKPLSGTKKTLQLSANGLTSNDDAQPVEITKTMFVVRNLAVLPASCKIHPMQLLEQQLTQNGNELDVYALFLKPEIRHAPIDAGRVAYLAEYSNFSLLVAEDVVHYPYPRTIKDSRTKLADLEKFEVDMLRQRGALSLPHWELCDDLIEAYFKWVAPVVPVINKSQFMRHYHDSRNPPSLLLLQAMFLAGSRVCNNPRLMDSSGSTIPAAMNFYKRAKALYDSDYESDRVIIVQALILIGWYWEESGDVMRNVFYWNGLATSVAQGCGMHRSAEGSRMGRTDKRLWKRIWWTLFTRDRSVAVALGRPVSIHTEDSDLEMISSDDFVEDDESHQAEYAPESVHVQFFLHYVRLCKIMSLILSQQHSATFKTRRHSAIALTESDMALADWLQDCPPEIKWDPSRYNFWSALIHCNYYTILCSLHRAYTPGKVPGDDPRKSLPSENPSYSSRNVASQAACGIVSIVESMSTHDEVHFSPAFMVYSLSSALTIQLAQTPSYHPATQHRIRICLDALERVSKVWPAAKMVHNHFETLLFKESIRKRAMNVP